jgi:membrane-bound metal-dependent hydrolase YbcI (DUF457 family)
MMIKTHLTVAIFFILLLLSQVEYSLAFAVVALVTTFIPDADTKFSSLGKKKILRPLQFFVKHRGILHSFTLLLILTLVFAFFVPVIALPFFLGYGLHIFLDSFTVDGVAPFYPYKKRIYGSVKSGSSTENFIFISFIIVDLILLLFKFSSF